MTLQQFTQLKVGDAVFDVVTRQVYEVINTGSNEGQHFVRLKIVITKTIYQHRAVDLQLLDK